MLELFQGVSGGPRNWILGWILPALLWCAAVGYFLLPHYASAPLPPAARDRALVLLGSTLVVGLLMSSFSMTLYRTLEGYSWPTPVRRWRISVHAAKQSQLTQTVEKLASPAESESPTTSAQVLEKLYRYPADPTQIAPTLFGNAIRSFETYGFDRYLLDSQSLWDELVSVVPDSLRQEEVDSRTPVNFFVATLWLDAAYLIAVVVTGIAMGWDGGLAVSVLLALALYPPLYIGAVRSCAGWGQAVKAVVNLGRRPLASALGVALPRRIESEREMWRAVGWFVADNYDASWAEELNRWRIPPDVSQPRRLR